MRKNQQIKYDTFGPFILPRPAYKNGNKMGTKRRKIDSENKECFWKSVNEKVPGLRDAVGCYVFALGKVPWYVGKTEKLGFASETWQSHKLTHYANALQARKRANPVMYLIAKRTPEGRFSKASKRGHRDIGFLENLMIGAALQRNEKLLNKRDTKYLRTMHVPGFMI